VQGHGGSGATALHIDHGHTFREQALAHQRREADLPADVALAEAAHAAVAEPGLFDPAAIGQAGVGQHFQVGLAGQVLETAFGLLAKGRAGLVPMR
jgi:hypothetical protein